jgi:cell division protein FtsZ
LTYQENYMAIEMIEEESFHQGTRIKVIGVGGGGGNAVSHMINSAVRGVEFICANTDAQVLDGNQAHCVIPLGITGRGAGGVPDRGREAAELAVEEIRTAIEGAHMLFITAGMGGGTGTGAAPVIARIAREMGILTVGVVTKPFEFEGSWRMKNAESGLAELEANVDSLIVVLNERLLEVLGEDATEEQGFAAANDVLKNAVGGIAEIINVKGHVNVDFEDVRTVMGEPGKAMMGTAQAAGPDRARIAAEQAVACPLLEGVDLSGARGVLVLISAAKGSLKLRESGQAMNTIRAFASEDAQVIYGTAQDDTLGDSIRVTVVATGLSRARPRPVLQVLPRTGTDNLPAYTPGFVAPAAAASGNPMPAVGQLAQGTAGLVPKDYSGLNGPAVWRSQRANAKVEALSLGGMQDIDIPAFLRKQAD